MSEQEQINICGQTFSWRKNTANPLSFCVLHELINRDGDVFSSGVLKDDAVRHARYRILTAPREEHLTLEEFRSVAMLVPVIPGRKGERGESANRFLLDERNSDVRSPLLREALRVYDLTPPDSRPDDREKFPVQFISALLGSCSNPSNTAIHLQIGENIRPIVFVNMQSHAALASVDSVVLAAYDCYMDDVSAPAQAPRCA